MATYTIVRYMNFYFSIDAESEEEAKEKFIDSKLENAFFSEIEREEIIEVDDNIIKDEDESL